MTDGGIPSSVAIDSASDIHGVGIGLGVMVGRGVVVDLGVGGAIVVGVAAGEKTGVVDGAGKEVGVAWELCKGLTVAII
jgi:hypothetical protein